MRQDKENQGQAKEHDVFRTLPDGTTETKTVTQAEWRGRDKSEGWSRADGVEDDAEDADADEG